MLVFILFPYSVSKLKSLHGCLSSKGAGFCKGCLKALCSESLAAQFNAAYLKHAEKALRNPFARLYTCIIYSLELSSICLDGINKTGEAQQKT